MTLHCISHCVHDNVTNLFIELFSQEETITMHFFNKIHLTLVLVFIILIPSISTENESTSITLNITKFFEKEKVFVTQEEYKIQADYMRLLELTLDFYKQTLDIEDKVDELSKTQEIEENEFEKDCQKYIELIKKVRRLVGSKRDESKSGALVSLVQLDDVDKAQFDVSTSLDRLVMKFTENSRKYEDDVKKLSDNLDNSKFVLIELMRHLEETGLPVGVPGKVDEDSLKQKGKTWLKTGNLLLIYTKDLFNIAERLENLGYFKDDFNYETSGEISKESIDHELNNLDNTKKILRRVYEETKDVFGPDTLWACVQGTKRLIYDVKIPNLVKKTEIRRENVVRLFTEITSLQHEFLDELKSHDEL